MKKIVLTGGGTAGHVTPNIALISGLQNEGWKLKEEFPEDFIADHLEEDEFYVDDFVEDLLVFHTKAAHESLII